MQRFPGQTVLCEKEKGIDWPGTDQTVCPRMIIMELLAIISATLLVAMGLFHFYWAFGGKIGLGKVLPTKDGQRLINPGSVPTFLVGVILLAFAFVAYALRFEVPPGDEVVYAGWALSVLFLLRAIGDFNAVGFFKKIGSTEFAKYDTKYFSPLCLFLGVAFALLSAQV